MGILPEARVSSPPCFGSPSVQLATTTVFLTTSCVLTFGVGIVPAVFGTLYLFGDLIALVLLLLPVNGLR